VKPRRVDGCLREKDMGGCGRKAVLGLAHMSWPRDGQCRLRVLDCPAVEFVSGNAFPPAKDNPDITQGLTTSKSHLRPKGRLVLADALALADEGQTEPDHLYANVDRVPARVAVGPESWRLFQR